MTRSMFILQTVLILMVTAVAPPAIAQNLVVNPNFDTDTMGWDGPGLHDTHDVDSSPTSGSSTYVNTSAGTAGFSFTRQCITLDAADVGYDASGWTYVASGQPATGYAKVSLLWYTDPMCASFLSAHSFPQSSVLDSWERSAGQIFKPHMAQSVNVSAVNQKFGPGDFQVFFDAMTFEPNHDMIFGGSFESGSTAEWTAVVQGPS